MSKTIDGPGPLDYNPQISTLKWTGGVIGRSKRANSFEKRHTIDITPGPGSYLIPYTVANLPKYSLNKPDKYRFV